MKNFEFFDYHVGNNNTLLAVVVAIDIAKGKSARSAKSAWLNEVKKLMPQLTEAVQKADKYDKWEELDSLVTTALILTGLTAEEAWNI